MNTFDKICGVPAVIIGVVLLILGVFGIFTGCNAHFTLPPILGGLPALVGWGIIRAVYLAWNTAEVEYSDGELHCRRCGYILRGISEPRCPECGERI